MTTKPPVPYSERRGLEGTRRSEPGGTRRAPASTMDPDYSFESPPGPDDDEALDLRNHPDMGPLPDPEEGRTQNDVEQAWLQRAANHIAPVAHEPGASSMPTVLMDGVHLGWLGSFQLGTSMVIRVVGRQGHRIQRIEDGYGTRLWLLERAFVALALVVAGIGTALAGAGAVFLLHWFTKGAP